VSVVIRPAYFCREADSLFFLLFFLLTAIATPITPVYAGNAHRRSGTTNDRLGIRRSHYRRRHREARRHRKPQKGKNPSTRNYFRFGLFTHPDLLFDRKV
jgi:hypothetical protein